MRAGEVMTRTVVSVEPDSSILHAIRVMLEKRVSGLPVVSSKGALVGIVTEGDFLRRAETETERQRPRLIEFLLGPGRLSDEYAHSHGRKVQEVMTRDVRTIAEDASLREVIETMEKHGIKRLPVLRGDHLVGIVTRANLMRALASLALVATPPAKDDAEIRRSILAEMDKQAWAPAATVTVAVENGVVELSGIIMDERQRAALKVLAENIPGVTKVIDRLALIDPFSGIVMDEKGRVLQGTEH
jgi:CBS domain-containing protein